MELDPITSGKYSNLKIVFNLVIFSEKDGIWAFLAWLQILARRRSTVPDLIRQHWKTFGRNVFTRYDYEDVDASGANLMMTYLEPLIPGYIGQEMKANNQVTDLLQYLLTTFPAFQSDQRRQLRVQRSDRWLRN